MFYSCIKNLGNLKIPERKEFTHAHIKNSLFYFCTKYFRLFASEGYIALTIFIGKNPKIKVFLANVKRRRRIGVKEQYMKTDVAIENI